jgi:hypothetical protein
LNKTHLPQDYLRFAVIIAAIKIPIDLDASLRAAHSAAQRAEILQNIGVRIFSAPPRLEAALHGVVPSQPEGRKVGPFSVIEGGAK